MSEKELNKTEIDLLLKGFKFTPTPNSNQPELISDIQKFHRRLRLREYFGTEDNSDKSIVRNKSDFNPPHRRDDNLEVFINTINNFPITITKTKDNLTHSERKGLNDLRNDNSIILKEADKGGSIIIMSKDYYKERVMEQLNDTEYYKQEAKNMDNIIHGKVKALVKKYSASFTPKEKDYVCQHTIKESNYYGLPKVQKTKKLSLLKIVNILKSIGQQT